MRKVCRALEQIKALFEGLEVVGRVEGGWAVVGSGWKG